jgi:L-threonylcarbamoyladenylate synthase
VVLPTDTVYGVAADPAVPGAEERLRMAKGRDAGKPIPLLAAGVDDVLARTGAIDPLARRLAGAFWPGPLTMVLPVGEGSEGFRVPDHALTLAVLRAAGGCLRVTSANRSGEPDARSADAAVAALGASVALVLDGGPVPGGIPSTVVRVSDGALTVLREGALSEETCRSA